MNLPKDCIEQIEKISQVSLNPKSCASGMKEALTNPQIYEAANLIPLDEALAFAEWVSNKHWTFERTTLERSALTNISLPQKGYWFNNDDWYPSYLTTTQLYTLYKEKHDTAGGNTVGD